MTFLALNTRACVPSN